MVKEHEHPLTLYFCLMLAVSFEGSVLFTTCVCPYVLFVAFKNHHEYPKGLRCQKGDFSPLGDSAVSHMVSDQEIKSAASTLFLVN